MGQCRLQGLPAAAELFARAADELERLYAVVRAADAMEQRQPAVYREAPTAIAYRAARAGVEVPDA